MMRRNPLVLLTFAVLMLAAAGVRAQDRIGVFFDADGTVTTATTTTPNQAVPMWLLLLEPTQPDVRAWECRVALDSEGPMPLAAWTLAGTANNFVSAPAFFVGLGNPLPAAPVVVLATGTLIVPEAGQEVTLRVTPFSTPSLDDPLAEGHTLMLPVYGSGPDLDLFPLTYANGCGLPVCRVNDDGAAGPPLLANVPAGLFFDPEITSYRIWLRNEGTQPAAGILGLEGQDYEFGLGDLLAPTIFDQRDRPFMVNPGGELLLEIRQAGGAVPGIAGQLVLDPCADPVIIELGEHVAGAGCRVLSNADQAVFDFGAVGLGFTVTREIRVRNDDPATVIRLEPTVVGDDFAYTGPAQMYVPPASSIMVPVVFQPTVLGDRLGLFDTGLGSCGTIELLGSGIVEDPNCVVATDLLAFGTVAVGVTVMRSVQVTNDSGGTLRCAPEIVDPLGCFSVNPNPFTLAPGQGRYVTVICSAPVSGAFAAELTLAPGCPAVELRASALPGVTSYTVAPDSIGFGPVDVGAAAQRIVTITNTGTLPVTVVPAISGETAFSTFGQFVVAPGTTGQMTVYFRPLAARSFLATLDLGLPGEETVSLTGEGLAITDRVGLYFDPAYTRTYWSTTVPEEHVMAFLVLHAPTAGAGVAGWDLCLDTYYGDARVVAWYLPATGVVGLGPDPDDRGCARVRYDTPLPWAQDILLATVEYLAPLPGSPSWITLAANPSSDRARPARLLRRGRRQHGAAAADAAGAGPPGADQLVPGAGGSAADARGPGRRRCGAPVLAVHGPGGRGIPRVPAGGRVTGGARHRRAGGLRRRSRVLVGPAAPGERLPADLHPDQGRRRDRVAGRPGGQRAHGRDVAGRHPPAGQLSQSLQPRDPHPLRTGRGVPGAAADLRPGRAPGGRGGRRGPARGPA